MRREERFEKKYDLTGIRKVSVQNVNGSIQIETGGDQLQVVAVKKVKTASDSDLLKDTEIRVTKTGSAIDMETVLPKHGHFFAVVVFRAGRLGGRGVPDHAARRARARGRDREWPALRRRIARETSCCRRSTAGSAWTAMTAR